MFNTKNSRFHGNKLIIIFLVMTASLFSQSWNDVVQTTIPFDNLVGLDLATNKDGIHILVNNHHASGGFPVIHTYTLKYYLLNSSGTVIRSYTLENFQGNNGGIQFASIDGANDRIYVVYKLWSGNQILTRKTTNAGQNWSNIANIDIGNNTCNHIDITFGNDDNALHVVWATQDAGSDYKTYYSRLDINNNWSATEDVTDGSNIGGFPTISKSQNRVHVSYNTGQSADPSTNTGEAKSRDKLTNTWQTPQLVYTPQSFRERIHAGSSKLFDFYYKLEIPYHANLYVKERSFGSTFWSSPFLLMTYANVYEIVSVTNTQDGKTHIVYEIFSGVGYRNYGSSSWTSEETIGSGYLSPRIYSVSNDLFVAWGRDWPNKYVQYRQFDAAPLAPENYALSVHQSGSNKYPKLTWSLNNEPDVRGNSQNAYKIERRTRDSGIGAWSAWSNIANLGGTVSSYIDFTINTAGGGDKEAEYRLTAIDLGSNASPSQSIVIAFGMGWADKISVPFTVNEYSLAQNYPNPFNPSTKISYSIKEDGFVTLKVYDILGVEIASLVNEPKTAGSYEAEFNAAQLPSGMYIYKLQSGSFTDVKKMLLTK